jgi:hypothetical protein
MQQIESSGIPRENDEETDLQQWMKFRIDKQKNTRTDRLSDYGRTDVQTTDGDMHPPHSCATVKPFFSLLSIKLSRPIEQKLRSLN